MGSPLIGDNSNCSIHGANRAVSIAGLGSTEKHELHGRAYMRVPSRYDEVYAERSYASLYSGYIPHYRSQMQRLKAVHTYATNRRVSLVLYTVYPPVLALLHVSYAAFAGRQCTRGAHSRQIAMRGLAVVAVYLFIYFFIARSCHSLGFAVIASRIVRDEEEDCAL